MPNVTSTMPARAESRNVPPVAAKITSLDVTNICGLLEEARESLDELLITVCDATAPPGERGSTRASLRREAHEHALGVTKALACVKYELRRLVVASRP